METKVFEVFIERTVRETGRIIVSAENREQAKDIARVTLDNYGDTLFNRIILKDTKEIVGTELEAYEIENEEEE